MTNNPHDQNATTLFKKNFTSTASVVVNQGGSNSGKTYSIIQVLFCLASETGKQVITVAGQDIPNLKVGALRDALTIYNSSKQLQLLVKNYNKTDRVFDFYNGSLIEFKSYGNAQDSKSGKRDYLFVNEANGIDYNIYVELALRTRKRVYIDYNPNNSFWPHEKLMGDAGVQVIISDHRHNPFLSDAEHNKIEALKEKDEQLWRVYARGITGRITGLVFNNWHVCDKIPTLAKPIAAGIDFGFTNDETGCIKVYKQDGELWIEELFYETGLTNPDIAGKLKEAGVSKKLEIIADSAEPKAIEELRRLGWYITGARKGADSIKNSIDILKRYKINITRGSVNLRKELERYKWRTDQAGKPLNQPVDSFNHLIDPLRYVALNKLKITSRAATTSKLPHKTQNYNDPIANQFL